MQEKPATAAPQKVTAQKTSWIKLGLVGVAIFVLGVLIGQGRIGLKTSGSNSSTSNLSAHIDYASVDEVYNALRANFDGKLTDQQVLDGLKHGLAASTNDPYTEFFSAKQAEEFNNDLQGTIIGVGAKLEKNSEGNIVVVAPIEGSPAQAAGVRAQDIIAGIDGKTTTGMSATDAVLKIRGEKGTKVTLTLIRNKTQRLDLTIVRDEIRVPTVTSKIEANNVGYMQVSQFSDDTDELAIKAAQDFKAKGVKSMVLDLRDNPGGEVVSATNLASIWLPKGSVVVEQRRGKEVLETDKTSAEPILPGMTVVVLINGGSASASEIVALALRDTIGSKIVGEKSFGKGVVQQLIPFDDGSALKVTVARWFSPKGTNIDKKGITPDQKVELTEADVEAGNDPQLQAALKLLTE
ncbi:MAG: S41 family peptidase [Candidatus Saccharimonadales bacterium]